jgi:26S proteasome regulatory subunit N8
MISQDGKAIVRTFKHISSEVGAYEAEEVGVEHLLRDINDPSLSSLSEQVRHKVQSLKGLKERLDQIKDYLTLVIEKKTPINKTILYNIQVRAHSLRGNKISLPPERLYFQL